MKSLHLLIVSVFIVRMMACCINSILFQPKYFNISCFQLYRINRVVEQNYDVIISFMEGISVKFHSYMF